MLKELNFPTVFEKGAKAGYGGNQEWFPQFWKRSAGCACTSGVNIAAYYASVDPGMRNLYNGNVDVFDRTEYVNAMEEMYGYMKPGLAGYPYVRKLAGQFVRFCAEHGVSVEANIMDSFVSTADAFSFVKENIDAGHPIALLILLHRAKQLKNDIWHWVTITGYCDAREGNDAPEIVISNCGQREILSADIIFEVHKKNRIRMVAFQKA